MAAAAFERIAELLEDKRAQTHRIHAYRRAAKSLRDMDRDLRDLARRGERALRGIPGVGPRLAPLLLELVRTGSIRLLERLEGEAEPQEALEDVPGIGEVLAHRLHDELHIDSLEDLELATYDGRLREAEGFGEQRIASLRGQLKRIFSRQARGERPRGPLGRRPPSASTAPSEGGATLRSEEGETSPSSPVREVPVELLLELDERYRRLAKAGKLRRIAPHRFNPDHLAWLPIMVAHRGGWRFDVMFSNTARAHQLDKTHEWVVIHHRPDGGPSDPDLGEGQHTVVTEIRGPDAGLRVVRGREGACHDHYRRNPPPRPKLELPDFLRPKGSGPVER
jgi:hypothetical protein